MRRPRPPRTRRPLRIAAAALAIGVVAAACSGSDDDPLAGTTATTAGASTDLVIAQLAARADLSDLAGAPWDERGTEVVSRLQATAESSQADTLELARQAGVDATSYWVTNVVVFEGDDDLARRVSELPGVETVYVEPLHPHVSEPDFTTVATDEVTSPTANVAAVHAPAAWADGRDGTGATVGVIDTGVDADHPALASSWGGDDAWHDALGGCDSPCDEVGHGTHVSGIALGGDPPSSAGDAADDDVPAIGVAPGASLLAARACGHDGCPETALLDAAQWMLAPGGDTSKRPPVLVNSWDLAPGDSSLSRLPDVWSASGQLPVFAAGNGGPECGTIGSPADADGAIAVGALDTDGTLAEQSSRGPAGAGLPVPRVWAPGQDVVSSLPGGAYGTGSGTSMAAPHVAGALALRLGSSTDTAAAAQDLLATLGPLSQPVACGDEGPASTVPATTPGSLDAAALARSAGS